MRGSTRIKKNPSMSGRKPRGGSCRHFVPGGAPNAMPHLTSYAPPAAPPRPCGWPVTPARYLGVTGRCRARQSAPGSGARVGGSRLRYAARLPWAVGLGGHGGGP